MVYMHAVVAAFGIYSVSPRIKKGMVAIKKRALLARGGQAKGHIKYALSRTFCK